MKSSIINYVLTTLALSKSPPLSVLRQDLLFEASEAVSAVLNASVPPPSSVIFISDGSTSPNAILQTLGRLDAPCGTSLLEIRAEDWGPSGNETNFSRAIALARKQRVSSSSVSIVVVSEDELFLKTFAEKSLRGRLLVWATRLLVVTRLSPPKLRRLLRSHWTFAMMNAAALNIETIEGITKHNVYVHMPYSRHGAQLVLIGTWTPRRGFRLRLELGLFPEKFDNFHGGSVNITSGVWPPFWDEKEVVERDGSKAKEYSGSDYMALETMSKALNFTFIQVPTANFLEVTKRVEERISFMSAIYYVTLLNRLERHDFTFTYMFTYESFCLAKPGLRPQWESLYYPLSTRVWASIMSVLVIVPLVLALIIYMRFRWNLGKTLDVGVVMLEIFKLLVGQDLSKSLFVDSSTRLVGAVWLVFAFVIGIAYRGNLTASLTLPMYPPRPETVAELVMAVDRINMPPYGQDWKKFFENSDSPIFQALAKLLFIGPSIYEGLELALQENQGLIGSSRYLEYTIAQDFTDANSEPKHYLGKNPIFPSPAAWPIPHDAPYKPQLDRYFMIIVESGLYNKWVEDMVEKARIKRDKKQEDEDAEEAGTVNGAKPLTLKHLQGPLLLLALGLGAAIIALIAEFAFHSCVMNNI